MSDGKYGIIAGHNRVAACKKLGFSTVSSVVKDIDENHAKLMMLDTNLCQRTELLPSEKAYAYKTQREMLIAIGSRRTTAELADRYGENRRTIQRYINCTRLIGNLMSALDKGDLTLSVADKLSAIDRQRQTTIDRTLTSRSDIKIDDKMANALQEACARGADDDEIQDIMLSKQKPKQTSKSAAKPKAKENEDEDDKEDYSGGVSSRKITLDRDRVIGVLGDGYEDYKNDELAKLLLLIVIGYCHPAREAAEDEDENNEDFENGPF